MQVEKQKPKKAIRELPIHLKVEHPYGNSLDIEIEKDWDSSQELTDAQIKDLILQIKEKINGIKVTLLATIFCPNCKKPIDETEQKGTFYCPDCKMKASIGFDEDKKK